MPPASIPSPGIRGGRAQRSWKLSVRQGRLSSTKKKSSTKIAAWTLPHIPIGPDMSGLHTPSGDPCDVPLRDSCDILRDPRDADPGNAPSPCRRRVLRATPPLILLKQAAPHVARRPVAARTAWSGTPSAPPAMASRLLGTAMKPPATDKNAGDRPEPSRSYAAPTCCSRYPWFPDSDPLSPATASLVR